MPHIIVRTSWVYATRGKNFLLTILRLATQRDELKIVQDQAGAPTASREIAAGTARILQQLMKEDASPSLGGKGGTYHMTAAGETTWYDFAKAILEESAGQTQNLPWFVAATNGRPLIAQRIVPITSAEYPTPAQRPANSILSNSRLEKIFGFALPDWRAQLQSAFTRKL